MTYKVDRRELCGVALKKDRRDTGYHGGLLLLFHRSFSDCVFYIRRICGFHQISRSFCGINAAKHLGSVRPCQKKHGDIRISRFAAYRLKRLQTVHFRHFVIRQKHLLSERKVTYETADHSSEGYNDFAPFKNLINELYHTGISGCRIRSL